MNLPTPHYLLFWRSSRGGDSGRWRFVVRRADGSQQFEAADVEPGVRGDRLDLLTVVRGLESLDQPSRVTLVDCSAYVRQGMEYGLAEWRSSGWRWEFFGEMVPVRNGDLWQRLDRTLRFHRVDCRRRRFDPPHETSAGREVGGAGTRGAENGGFGISARAHRWVRYWLSPLPAHDRRPLAAVVRWWRRRRVTPSWTAAAACPRAGSLVEVR